MNAYQHLDYTITRITKRMNALNATSLLALEASLQEAVYDAGVCDGFGPYGEGGDPAWEQCLYTAADAADNGLYEERENGVITCYYLLWACGVAADYLEYAQERQ